MSILNDECLALPLFRELGKLPTLCVLNWNAVSLSNSEPLDGVPNKFTIRVSEFQVQVICVLKRKSLLLIDYPLTFEAGFTARRDTHLKHPEGE